jgi:RNA-binding motif X-linked protein 2
MDDVTRELQEKGCGANTPSPSSSVDSEDDKPMKKPKKGKVLRVKRRFWIVLVSTLLSIHG